MNSWNLSGEVLRSGIKGKQYPKLWVQLDIAAPQGYHLSDNRVFINFDLDLNKQSNKGRVGEFVQSQLEKCRFAFVSDITVCKMKQSKKNSAGEWESEEIIGLKSNIKNIVLADSRYPIINQGAISGNVSKFGHDVQKKLSKFVVEDRYRTPKDNTWHSRPIPVLSADTTDDSDLTGKSVFVDGAICGQTPAGENKVYIWTKNLIKMG